MIKQINDLKKKNHAIYSKYLLADQRYHAISNIFNKDKEFINFASASDMHLVDKPEYKNILVEVGDLDQTVLTKYPGLASNTINIENKLSLFLKKWLDLNIPATNIISFLGAFGSYSAILSALDGNYVLCSEITYDYQKACFSSLKKKIVEIKVNKDGLININSLEKVCRKLKGQISILYFNYGLGKSYTKKYLDSLADLADKYNFLILCDCDAFYTNHNDESDPALPLKVKKFQENAIVIINVSKEIGTPSLRIGFGITSKKLIKNLKLFQDARLEIQPQINKEILNIILNKTDLDKSKKILRSRMRLLVNGLNALGWKVQMPDVGINLFIDVPISFSINKLINPGEIFSYYCMKFAKTKIRPGNINGKRLNNKCRFVISTTENEIKEVITRFEKSEINYNMPFPKGLISEFQKVIRGITKIYG